MKGRNRDVAARGGDGRDLVARIAAGDRGAEAEFVDVYARGVQVLVRRHCRPGDPVADDMAQEVITRVLERLRAGAIRDAAALPAYMQATIVRTTRAAYRARRPEDAAVAIEQIPGPENPLDRAAATQLAAVLRALLAQLPRARDREILARFYLDGQNKDDVCRHLGIDAAHFHRVVFRARARFRELLDSAGIGEA